MSQKADKAYAAAQKKIAWAQAFGETRISFDGPEFHALENIPPELRELDGLTYIKLNKTQINDLTPLRDLSGLRVLYLDHTGVNDLTPLRDLSGLQVLDLNQTGVDDLRPLLSLAGFAENSKDANIFFEDSAATKQDARLHELSLIDDSSERLRETRAYLQSLPPWPAPYTPQTRPDGKPPEPIGPSDPTIPNGLHAPLEVEEVGGILRPAMPGDRLDDQGQLLAQQGWEALRDFLADLTDLRPRLGNQMPSAERALARFESTLGVEFDQLNQIALGTHGQRIIRQAAAADETLMAADAAELKEFAASVALFLERFPDWRAYRNAAYQDPPDLKKIKDAADGVDDLARGLEDDESIDPQIPKALHDLADDARQSPEDEIIGRGLLTSAHNVIASLAQVVWRGVKATGKWGVGFGKLVWDDTQKIASKAIAGGIVGLASTWVAAKVGVLKALAIALPEWFGWLLPFLAALSL